MNHNRKVRCLGDFVIGIIWICHFILSFKNYSLN
jgi:hypothetical protein